MWQAALLIWGAATVAGMAWFLWAAHRAPLRTDWDQHVDTALDHTRPIWCGGPMDGQPARGTHTAGAVLYPYGTRDDGRPVLWTFPIRDGRVHWYEGQPLL